MNRDAASPLPSLTAQLRAPSPVGRDLALLRTRLYRFSDDLRWYVLAEAFEEYVLAGRSPQAATLAEVRATLTSIRTTGKVPPYPGDLARAEGIDIDAGLQARAADTWRAISDAQQPKRVVLIVGAPRSGTSHLYNLLARTGRFAYFTTASCWAWPVRNLRHLERQLFTGLGDQVLAVDNKRTRLIPGLVMPGEAEDIWQRAIPAYRHIAGHRYEIRLAVTSRLQILDAAADAHAAFFHRDVLLTKSPFCSFRIPQIEEHWGSKVRYIHIIRDQHAAAESMRRNRFEFISGGYDLSAEQAWSLFTSAVDEHAPTERVVTVRHEVLLQDPGSILGQILGDLAGHTR